MDTATLQAITLGCSKNKVDTEHLLAAMPFCLKNGTGRRMS